MERFKVFRRCSGCGFESYITIECTEAERQDYLDNYFMTWKPKPIQDIFPNISKREREFIKSGLCFSCQDLIFGEEND